MMKAEKFWVQSRGKGMDYDTITTTECETLEEARDLQNSVPTSKLFLAVTFETGLVVLQPIAA